MTDHIRPNKPNASHVFICHRKFADLDHGPLVLQDERGDLLFVPDGRGGFRLPFADDVMRLIRRGDFALASRSAPRPLTSTLAPAAACRADAARGRATVDRRRGTDLLDEVAATIAAEGMTISHGYRLYLDRLAPEGLPPVSRRTFQRRCAFVKVASSILPRRDTIH